MRRILVEIARRQGGPEGGGEHCRVELSDMAATQGPDAGAHRYNFGYVRAWNGSRP